MTAVEARRNTDFRRRVCDVAHAGDRALKDLLDGYAADSMTARRLRAALEAEGVDLGTIPKRTPAEVQAWKRGRQPALTSAMPKGFAVETCDCGREYPRLQSEADGKCPKCWRKVAEAFKRERDEAHGEIEGLQRRAAGGPVSTRRKE
jgi:hypothetical protein